jgi:hypothetical protein
MPVRQKTSTTRLPQILLDQIETAGRYPSTSNVIGLTFLPKSIVEDHGMENLGYREKMLGGRIVLFVNSIKPTFSPSAPLSTNALLRKIVWILPNERKAITMMFSRP